MTRFGEIAQRGDDRGLEAFIDRTVWVIEIAERSHPQERFALFIHPVDSTLAAGGAQFQRIDPVKIKPQMFERFELDRQTVHVPARHEFRIFPIEEMHFDEDIFEYAV